MELTKIFFQKEKIDGHWVEFNWIDEDECFFSDIENYPFSSAFGESLSECKRNTKELIRIINNEKNRIIS